MAVNVPSSATLQSVGASAPPRPANASKVVPRAAHPLREAIASGKMPVIQELHLTGRDIIGYQRLRQRYLTDTTALPDLTFLGQYLRQLDSGSGDLTPEERDLTHKLQVYAELLNGGKIDMISLDDGPRGREALDNAIAAELLAGVGVEPIRLMANVVARNRNVEQIHRRLVRFSEIGLRTVLLVTGDLPDDPQSPAKFPLDSVGMCELAREMRIDGTLPEDFLVAAAGHPNPDADPDGLRTLQKALAGARIIITQVIHDVAAFENWMRSIRELGVPDMAHVFAEMIPITSSSQLRAISEIPGMRVPAGLLDEFVAEEERIASTARAGSHDEEWVRRRRLLHGANVTRSMLHRIRKVNGVSGLYLGCVRSFGAHLELLKEMPLLAGGPHGDRTTARLSGPERQRALAQLPEVEGYLDRMLKDARQRQRGTIRRALCAAAGSAVGERLLKILEWPKVPVFGCKKCDRCDLSADALVCPRGCAKQMSHGPCGAPRAVDGRVLCEDTSRECTWAAIRAKRRAYGIPMHERIETREAPSQGFYEGRGYSAFLPVFKGRKSAPRWSLAFRAPWVALMRLFNGNYALQAEGSPLDLSTAVRAKAVRLRALLRDRVDMNREELLIKALALVGTPQAIHLIESRMSQLGLPADGTFGELSIREQFLVAEALPPLRRRLAGDRERPGVGSLLRYEELLAVVPEGTALRRALRRELASGLIRYVASLGVRVTYTDALLGPKQVESLLLALTILKEELQLAPHRAAARQTRLGVHFNRIHYKQHYRAPIAVRRYATGDQDGNDHTELVVDLRQFGSADLFRANLRAAFAQVSQGGCECRDALMLEPFVGEADGVCWGFNSAFWQRLADFEEATGVRYDESIGGSTDRNQEYVRSTARAYFDRLHEHGLADERFYIVEIGVASTQRATLFLDELRRICRMAATDYYDRTVYVLADYAQDILDRGVAELTREHPHVQAVRIDAASPVAALKELTGHVMHVHVCNVYDNLPTDKLAWVDDRVYGIQGRAYLSRATMAELLSRHGFAAEDAEVLERQLAALADDPEACVAELLDWARDRLIQLGHPPLAYVAFWMDLFHAIRVEERYVPVSAESAGADPAAPLEDVDELLRRIMPTGRSVRVHLNGKALRGFVELLRVLHPHGVLEVVDLFVQRIDQYYQAFKGPAKYDGSTVNWLNGPLFREVGERLGYRVRFHAFKPFSPKSPSVIMTATRTDNEPYREEAFDENDEGPEASTPCNTDGGAQS